MSELSQFRKSLTSRPGHLIPRGYHLYYYLYSFFFIDLFLRNNLYYTELHTPGLVILKILTLMNRIEIIYWT